MQLVKIISKIWMPHTDLNLALNYPGGHLRAQEYDGEFANEGGKIGDRAWFINQIMDNRPNPVNKRVRFWDLAATEKKVVGIGRRKELNDPDEFVGTLISSYFMDIHEGDRVIKDTHWCIEDQVSGRMGMGKTFRCYCGYCSS